MGRLPPYRGGIVRGGIVRIRSASQLELAVRTRTVRTRTVRKHRLRGSIVKQLAHPLHRLLFVPFALVAACTSSTLPPGQGFVFDAGPLTDSASALDTGTPLTDSGAGADTGPVSDTAVAGDAAAVDVALDGGAIDTGDCKPTVPPTEKCDNIDNDCDGETDNGACDDDNQCTDQKCDSVKGAAGEDGCSYSLPSGTPCDDGSKCTTDDACTNGICAPGAKKQCDDGNSCTIDACKADTGLCSSQYLGDGKFCNDGKTCTNNDTCTGGVCVGKATANCDDANPCTVDDCNDAGACSHTPKDGLLCNDNNPCTAKDACTFGACIGGDLTVCDDSKPCTNDFCDPAKGGCVYQPKLLGSPCSDGLCSTGGSCDQVGSCVGQKKLCDDGKTCTVDACEPATGKCSNTPLALGTPCDDGEACTTGEACDAASACTPPAGQQGCDDGNSCTEDICNVATKACSHKVKTGACDDGNACTAGESCVTGKCLTGATPKTTLVAGSGATGYQDGNGQAAKFAVPRGVHLGPDGTIYVADRDNHRVRTISPQGQVGTLAGSGTKGYVDGAGSNASFASPEDMTVGGDGSVYVADSGNHRIRRVSTKGEVSNYAGNGSGTWKDGVAGSSSFYNPQGIAVDKQGNVYVADTFNQRIRKIGSATNGVAGVVTTLAGSGTAGFKEGKGAAAQFNYPWGISVAANGVVYVADGNNHRVRRVAADGTVTTLAGDGSKGYLDGAAASARFSTPADVFALATGDVAVVERDGNRVRLITASGTVVTVAGTGTAGYVEGAGSVAQFNLPWGITGDKEGTLIVADTVSNRIRRLQTGVKTCNDGNACTLDKCDTKLGACQHDTLKAGDACDDGSSCSTGDTCDFAGQCKGTTKSCDDKSPCTTDSCNAFTGECEYVALAKTCNDGDACTLADICLGGKCVSGAGDAALFSGSGVSGFADGAAASARFYHPDDVAVDAAGNVYVADRYNHRIRKVTVTGTASVLSGSGSASFLDGAGTSARFYYPAGIAVDTKGVVYVADYNNHRVRKVQANGMTSTLAGSGTGGFLDGVGTTARFYYPEGLDVDAAGNVYVADRSNNRIRKITASGAVSTVAGSASSGIIDGPAATARFNQPYDVVLGKTGDLFVADYGNHRIRKIAPDGNVTTFVGSSTSGKADGNGAGATLTYPSGLAVDPVGNLILVEQGAHLVRRVTMQADVYTLAGTAGQGYANGTPAAAKFNSPAGVAVAKDGTIYIADYNNYRIRKLLPTQTVCNDGDSCTADSCNKTTGKCVFSKIPTGGACDDGDACSAGATCSAAGKCGGGKAKTCSDGNACTQDLCNSFSGGCYFPPTQGVCSDGEFCTVNDRCANGKCVGNLSDVYTFAGSTAGILEGPGPKAKFNAPRDVAVSGTGVVYIADRSNQRIRRISADGVVTTLAGQASAGFTEGQGATARFYYPAGVTVNKSGNILVADSYNYRIRLVTPSGATSTFAGQSSGGYSDGKGAAARFNRPEGVETDLKTGMTYVADTYNHRIRRIDPVGNVTFVAGSGSASFLDGAATSARFYYPRSVAIDSKGNIYVADSSNHRIRRIAAAGFAVTTIAGNGNTPLLNGKGVAAQFNTPHSVAVGADDAILVADYGNHVIRLIAQDGLTTTFAGTGTAGLLDESTDIAQFYSPMGVTVDSKGATYIADANNHRIRKVASAIKSCGDGTECTINTCDEAADKCTTVKAADLNPCTDGNLCLLGAICNSGKCVGGVDKNASGGCDDKNTCTIDSCNKDTGECTYKPAAGCVASRRVFLTSAIYDANLGGVAGGHAKCQGLAEAAGLGGTWNAWLSDSVEWPALYFDKSSVPYRRLDGQTIALNWNDLVDGTLDNPISINEKGQPVGPSDSASLSYCSSSYKPKVHTGTSTSGVRNNSSSSANCVGWKTNTTSTSSFYYAATGIATSTSSTWTYACTSDKCSSSYRGHLYCFEQTNFYSKP